MSEFTDFMTMKLIEERRLRHRGFSNKEIEVDLLEQINAVKNLNVRIPINTIAEIETLANWAGTSKAELVLEMLSSCISDAIEMMHKEGTEKYFFDSLYEHLEKDYDVKLKRDENGEVTSFSYSGRADSSEHN
ncbi:MAG: hypothetical protein ACMZ63_01670 [Methylotenera sp.]